jgi:hypothetical protein
LKNQKFWWRILQRKILIEGYPKFFQNSHVIYATTWVKFHDISFFPLLLQTESLSAE